MKDHRQAGQSWEEGPVSSPWRHLWAKTLPTNNESRKNCRRTHPLWAHLLDVAVAAECLWESYLPKHLRTRISESLGLTTAQAGRLLCIWIGLHDVGKAMASFQNGHTPSRQYLNEQFGLNIQSEYNTSSRIHHSCMSIVALLRWIGKRRASGVLTAEGVEQLEQLSIFVGFHHGWYWSKASWEDELESGDNGRYSNATWQRLQEEIVDAVLDAWGPVTLPTRAPEEDQLHSWLPAFLGLATTADWLASNKETITWNVHPDDDLATYLEQRCRPGMDAIVRKAGFTHRAALTAPGFLELFGNDEDSSDRRITAMRPIQAYVATMPLSRKGGPTLTVIEGPTGEGKTEAGYYLAARQYVQLVRTYGQAPGGGIYIAMPTQAMSNEQFKRLKKFLLKAHHDPHGGAINLRLVHGSDILDEEQQTLLAQEAVWTDIHDSDSDGDGSLPKALTASWFLPRKQSLLAPYGVGTVDQALLGALNCRHSYLRLFGLAGKTVIFDEIHAYDFYVSTLFSELLRWLKEMGSHVILLSATLPRTQLEQYLAAWNNTRNLPSGGLRYPAITHVHPDGRLALKHGPRALKTAWSQRAAISWEVDDVDRIVRRIVDAVAHGATVAAMFNVVARAQNVFDKLKKLLPNETITLFHAAFRHKRRKEIENAAKQDFGPDYERESSRPCVLVATQVAEQSLDLDFDFLITDIAPVDLLLQRAGRLHRHLYGNGKRPNGYTTPSIVIVCPKPPAGSALPNLESVAPMYDASVVWRTHLLLRAKRTWRLPRDYRPFIEEVYGVKPDTIPVSLSQDDQHRWLTAIRKEEREHTEAEHIARSKKFPPPERLSKLYTKAEPGLVDPDDEMPEMGQHLKALTRLGDSISIICLFRSRGKLYFDPACNEACDIGEARTIAQLQSKKRIHDLRELNAPWMPFLGNSMRVSHKLALGVLREEERTTPNDTLRTWNEIRRFVPALRSYHLLVLTEGTWRRNGCQITYNDRLGLCIAYQ